MRKWLALLRDLLVFTLLAPQVFTLSYHMGYLFRGSHKWMLLKSLLLLGLAISRVTAPLLALVFFGASAQLERGMKWPVFLLLSLVVGSGFPLLWNAVVFPSFDLLKALLPMVLTVLLCGGYALARREYQLSACSCRNEAVTNA